MTAKRTAKSVDPLAEKYRLKNRRRGTQVHYRNGEVPSEAILDVLPRVVWAAFHYDKIFNGLMIVNETSLHLAHNLGVFFMPNLNSTAFLNELKTLVERGEIQRVVGYVRKITTKNGVKVPTLRKVFLYAGPKAVLPAGCVNDGRSYVKSSGSETRRSVSLTAIPKFRIGSMREKLGHALPVSVPDNIVVTPDVPGTTVHCARTISGDSNASDQFLRIVGNGLFKMYKAGKIGCVQRVMMTSKGPKVRNVFYSGRPDAQVHFTEDQLRETVDGLKA